MRIDRPQVKQYVRTAMREHQGVYLAALVLLVITFVLDFFKVRLSYPGYTFQEIVQNCIDLDKLEYMLAFSSMRQNIIHRLLLVAIMIVGIVLQYGFTLTCLRAVRGQDVSVANLFDSFEIWLKLLWLNVLRGLFTFLWTLLLIIPGFVAAYRYSLAEHILLDDPRKTAMQCIRESKQLTNGHKGELFMLDLSLIGWQILSAIPFVSIYTSPYMTMCRCEYYRIISGQYEAPVSSLSYKLNIEPEE